VVVWYLLVIKSSIDEAGKATISSINKGKKRTKA